MWTRASQEAYWAQRRSYWSRVKFSKCQSACRRRGLWEGGFVTHVRDRLLRSVPTLCDPTAPHSTGSARHTLAHQT